MDGFLRLKASGLKLLFPWTQLAECGLCDARKETHDNSSNWAVYAHHCTQCCRYEIRCVYILKIYTNSDKLTGLHIVIGTCNRLFKLCSNEYILAGSAPFFTRRYREI